MTTTRRFELVDDRSRKFWEIAVTGATLEVRFGRLGAAGQVQQTALGAPAEAARSAAAQIARKLGKGYREVVVAAAGLPRTLRARPLGEIGRGLSGSRPLMVLPAGVHRTWRGGLGSETLRWLRERRRRQAVAILDTLDDAQVIVMPRHGRARLLAVGGKAGVAVVCALVETHVVKQKDAALGGFDLSRALVAGRARRLGGFTVASPLVLCDAWAGPSVDTDYDRDRLEHLRIPLRTGRYEVTTLEIPPRPVDVGGGAKLPVSYLVTLVHAPGWLDRA